MSWPYFLMHFLVLIKKIENEREMLVSDCTSMALKYNK